MDASGAGNDESSCFYDRVPPHEPSMVPAAPFGSGTAEARVAAAISRPPGGADEEDPPETKERRVIELKLLHRYISETGGTVAIDEKTRSIYCSLIPELALQSDALLYCMYSLAALHMAAASESREPAVINTHRKYLSMALREHNKALADLSPASADVVCLTSSLFRVCSFTLLQERQRQPYEPPVEWLMMNASTTAVFKAAFKIVGSNHQSVAYRMLHTTPVIHDEKVRFDEASRKGLEFLVQRDPDRDADEPWDVEIREAYETTLSYLGGIIEGARKGEVSEVCRRLIIFPMLVKGRFIELVQEGRSRAMLLLSYYFALLSLYRHVWWIGRAGLCEVRCIAKSLTGHWLSMMRWPLQVIETGQVPPVTTGDCL